MSEPILVVDVGMMWTKAAIVADGAMRAMRAVSLMAVGLAAEVASLAGVMLVFLLSILIPSANS